jgi:hypothetical protein
MRTRYDLAGVIKRFGKNDTFTTLQTKTLINIAQCRTALLGGHEDQCDCCGKTRQSYNSCRDRHCPKCQATKQAIWVEQLIKSTLPVKHYHIIFTVPHVLNKICLFNNRIFYNVLFSAVWRTLYSFGYSHYGLETGAVCVLHSWGQNICLHPHIHCIVPAAGYSLRGEWKNMDTNNNFLYPVYELSKTFKGKFLDSLKRKLKKIHRLEEFTPLIEKSNFKKWVVHCEPSMAKADHVIKYLGQYTHRVAITNQRILNISDTHVSFIAKDYRDRAIKKPVSLRGEEFIRRFCMHVLPIHFVKIRRYGIYNPTRKRNLDLQFFPNDKADLEHDNEKAREETPQQRLKRLTGFDVYQCPFCKKGRMVAVRFLPPIRAPDQSLKDSWSSIFA